MLAAIDRWAGKVELVLGKRRGGTSWGTKLCYFSGRRMGFTDDPVREGLAKPEPVDPDLFMAS